MQRFINPSLRKKNPVSFYLQDFLFRYFLNNTLKASSTFFTRIISILVFERLMELRLKSGIIILVKPSFSASRIRCSIRLMGRISPERPTSPAIHTFFSMAMSTLDDRMAEITARSMAGSLTLSPPAMFRKTCFCAILKPARYSSTASNILSRRMSKPVQERCGVP